MLVQALKTSSIWQSVLIVYMCIMEWWA